MAKIKVQAKNAELEADDIQEGSSGLILKDEEGNRIGYVPFKNLDYAEPGQ